MESKENFMDYGTHCDLCGRQEDALSRLKLFCGYGSAYDMESITMNLCGDCADRLYIRMGERKEVMN